MRLVRPCQHDEELLAIQTFVLQRVMSILCRIGCDHGSWLIPTCVLSDRSKVREVRHGTQAFGLGFQLGKSDTEFVNHLIKRGTSEIGKVLFAQMFPEMFRRIEFRAVGWLWDQADVLRHLEIFGMMPSRLISPAVAISPRSARAKKGAKNSRSCSTIRYSWRRPPLPGVSRAAGPKRL